MTQLKNLVSITILLFFYATAFSQKASTYYLDSSLKKVSKSSDNYVYKCKGVRTDSLFSIDCFDKETKNLRVAAHFSDSLLTDLHGNFTRYFFDGSMESMGYYTHGSKTGVWQSWNKNGTKTDSSIYANNERIAFASFAYFQTPEGKAVLYQFQFTDSLKNTFKQVLYSNENSIASEANFTGNTGVEKIYDKGNTITDSVFTREQEEPVFPGGTRGWARHMVTTLGGFSPRDYGATNGKYQVIVRFLINTDGSISDVIPETDFGHSMEQKAVEVIKSGPNWKPAVRFGRPAKVLRRQPLTFVVEGD